MYFLQGGRDLSTPTVPGGYLRAGVDGHEANRMGEVRGEGRKRNTELVIVICLGLVLPALGCLILTMEFFPKVSTEGLKPEGQGPQLGPWGLSTEALPGGGVRKAQATTALFTEHWDF